MNLAETIQFHLEHSQRKGLEPAEFLEKLCFDVRDNLVLAPLPSCKHGKKKLSAKKLLDKDWIEAVLVYGFGWAIKDCVKAASLPDSPKASAKLYTGEQIQRLGIMGKHGLELHIKTEATMRLSKARKSGGEVDDLNAALQGLLNAVSAHSAKHFGETGFSNDIGACNYPDEDSGKVEPIRWNGHIITFNFRAHTYLDRAQQDPGLPKDPMDPTYFSRRP